MEKKEKYTEGQKVFLKLKTSALTEEEKDMLRVLMLPRNHYFPDTDKEREALAREILRGESYIHLADFRAAMREMYGDFGEWCRGQKDVILYCRFRKGGKTICTVALRPDSAELIIRYGKRECELFAQERDHFPREGILWPYDYFSGKEPNKVLRYDLSERSLWLSYFRLISIRAE